jgi:hypothetical protein
MMGNIATWLRKFESEFGELIEAVVVGVHDNRRYGADSAPLPDENVILSRAAGLAKLDQDHDDGYGGADCFPMYAWTASRVAFIGEYDGATSLSWVPRHPIACAPGFSGD